MLQRYRINIDPEKVRDVVDGGKMIKKIIADTGVKIDIEDDGKFWQLLRILIQARKNIEGLGKEVEVGGILGKWKFTIWHFFEFLPVKKD